MVFNSWPLATANSADLALCPRSVGDARKSPGWTGRTDQLGNQCIMSRGGGGAGCANVGVGRANGGATWTNGADGGATRSKAFTGFGFKVGGVLFEKNDCFAGG